MIRLQVCLRGNVVIQKDTFYIVDMAAEILVQTILYYKLGSSKATFFLLLGLTFPPPKAQALRLLYLATRDNFF